MPGTGIVDDNTLIKDNPSSQFRIEKFMFQISKKILASFFSKLTKNYLDNPDNEELRMIYPRYFPPPPPPPPPPFR
ncbi:hypothetical protein DERP_014114 [Dermatophagoides pteronyssinus]|uniref:Uncharacterized protein n=1 Tax=Dermatophagoides pteronyssinus TaxID=6956 RepID=A0ABQ8IXX2_DERPT|nr:hypothetical protein DERP_014114 [Dermatophagoides pteronyssinus]